MNYEIVLEFEKKEIYPLSEIIEILDYSIPNPDDMLNKAFTQIQNEKVKRYLNEVLMILDENNIHYEYKIVKILPKYLQDGIDKIPFRLIFQIKLNKQIKDKKFTSKFQNNEFQLIKESIPGLKKLIEILKPSKIFIKKT
jgi:hypothetical protein